MIETERLFLREMNEYDYDALYLVLSDSDIMKHYPYTFDEKRVRGWFDSSNSNFTYRLLPILPKSTPSPSDNTTRSVP